MPCGLCEAECRYVCDWAAAAVKSCPMASCRWCVRTGGRVEWQRWRTGVADAPEDNDTFVAQAEPITKLFPPVEVGLAKHTAVHMRPDCTSVAA